MIQPGRRSLFLISLIGTLALALGVLATLEYRWAGIIREASRDRMQAELHTAVSHIQAEFDREIRNLCHSLDPASLPLEGREYSRNFALWRQQSPHPEIVANVYAFAFTSNNRRVLQWNAASNTFEAPSHPDRLATLSAGLASYSPPVTAQKPMKAEPLLWALPESAPLLIQASGRGRARRFVVIELSTERLKTDLFPDLVSRYLGSHRSTDFQIGVLGGLHNTLLYQSDPSLSSDTFRYWDEKVFLFEGFRFFSTAGTGDKWMLVAKDRQGSLAAAAAKLSHRWLAVNFGVLIVLALGLATIVVSMLRAQAFLKLQMEFVAGVSHELRTPLSVIGSAADNLAEGVVRSAKDVQEYGALIRSECRRLSGLVEQTLRFSAAKADIRSRDIQFFRITDVIDRALSAAVTAIDGNRLSLEKIVDPNLPMVRADPDLLSECLLNLISNALKYGGDAQWLGIRAQTVETGHGTGVQITVEDRGIGISAAELRHVFEPFYRGQTARSAQIRGTGLGLSLAREAANSMGARITVKSAVGKGSAFTLHIPPAYMNSSTVPVEALVES
jgi:signal transduction histidine kinase